MGWMCLHQADVHTGVNSHMLRNLNNTTGCLEKWSGVNVSVQLGLSYNTHVNFVSS